MFHNCDTEKITRKASDAAENLQCVQFFRRRSLCTTHLMLSLNIPNICVVHDDLGWKNRTTHYNRFGELAAVD